MGSNMTEARLNLYVAIINAGASQSLIKIEAVEIAMIPTGRKRKRRIIPSKLISIRISLQVKSFHPIIRNDEMLNQARHDNRGELSVTLKQVLNLIQDLRFQGLMNTDTWVFDYGLWSSV